MINLFTLFPSQLNLDGDQGNLLALKKYLVAAGFDVSVRMLTPDVRPEERHFVLFGHGSLAAMESIDGSLGSLDWSGMFASPGLAVGSAFEYLSRKLIVGQVMATGERQSSFEVEAFGNLTVLGYRNTDSGLPNLALNGQWICTMLHGPVLAKNPILLDRAARAAVKAAGLQWPSENSVDFRTWVETLNRVSAEIWKIETEKPFQKLVI
jgi:lipid II isoglutaminyl synthase (glutamine-hydrolysing)